MDAKTARTLNIRRWVADADGPSAFAEKYGGGQWVAAQVSQWVSETKPKGIGHNLARAIEAKLGKQVGSMDRAPQDSTSLPASQPARIDPDTVLAAHKLLRDSYADGGKVYDIEAEPDLFAIVYERLASIADKPQLADLVSIGRAIEQRQQGATDDKGESDKRTGGPHSQPGRKRASG